jgi:hypothetical protein
MREQHHFRTLPLLLGSRNLVRLKFPLTEIRNSVDDNPWNGTPKVYKLETLSKSSRSLNSEKKNLVKQETHEARCNNWVIDPDVPSGPHLFKPTEFREVNVRVKLLSGSLCRVRSGSSDSRRVESHDG